MYSDSSRLTIDGHIRSVLIAEEGLAGAMTVLDHHTVISFSLPPAAIRVSEQYSCDLDEAADFLAPKQYGGARALTGHPELFRWTWRFMGELKMEALRATTSARLPCG